MREKVWKKNGRVGAATPRERRKEGGRLCLGWCSEGEAGLCDRERERRKCSRGKMAGEEEKQKSPDGGAAVGVERDGF